MTDVPLDATDHDILSLLQRDARRTLADMASRVNLSTAAVKRRIDRLQEAGVILGYTVKLDHAKLGLGIAAFIELRFTGTTRIDEIIETTTRMPEAQAVFTIAGDPDALLWLRVRDVAHLQRTIDKIRHGHGVTGTRTLIVLGSWFCGDGEPTT